MADSLVMGIELEGLDDTKLLEIVDDFGELTGLDFVMLPDWADVEIFEVEADVELVDATFPLFEVESFVDLSVVWEPVELPAEVTVEGEDAELILEVEPVPDALFIWEVNGLADDVEAFVDESFLEVEVPEGASLEAFDLPDDVDAFEDSDFLVVNDAEEAWLEGDALLEGDDTLDDADAYEDEGLLVVTDADEAWLEDDALDDADAFEDFGFWEVTDADETWLEGDDLPDEDDSLADDVDTFGNLDFSDLTDADEAWLESDDFPVEDDALPDIVDAVNAEDLSDLTDDDSLTVGDIVWDNEISPEVDVWPGDVDVTEGEVCDALPEDVVPDDWLSKPVDFEEDGLTEGETLVAELAELVEE